MHHVDRLFQVLCGPHGTGGPELHGIELVAIAFEPVGYGDCERRAEGWGFNRRQENKYRRSRIESPKQRDHIFQCQSGRVDAREGPRAARLKRLVGDDDQIIPFAQHVVVFGTVRNDETIEIVPRGVVGGDGMPTFGIPGNEIAIAACAAVHDRPSRRNQGIVAFAAVQLAPLPVAPQLVVSGVPLDYGAAFPPESDPVIALAADEEGRFGPDIH